MRRHELRATHPTKGESHRDCDADTRWMRAALRQAALAAAEGEVPVGAVVVHGGRVIRARTTVRFI